MSSVVIHDASRHRFKYHKMCGEICVWEEEIEDKNKPCDKFKGFSYSL